MTSQAQNRRRAHVAPITRQSLRLVRGMHGMAAAAVTGMGTLTGAGSLAGTARHKLAALALAVLGCALSPLVSACTLWGAAGEASLEGTLLVKNRDWKPDHVQSLRLVRGKHGMAFLALYADEGRAPGIKAGVNQTGLSVVSASASSLSRAEREEDPARHGVMLALLRDYHNLAEVAQHAQEIFPHAKPVFLLLADPSGLMQVEIGQQGNYNIEMRQRGTLAHTNHYFDTKLLHTAQKIGDSSATRLARINALLQQQSGAHTLAEFGKLSFDQHDGADNSLWRSGKEYTLASWQLALPRKSAPKLHLVLANPGQTQQTSDWQLDAGFWAQSPHVLAGGK